METRRMAWEVRQAWRRWRYRRALSRRLLRVPAAGVHVSYGDVQPRPLDGSVRGGSVKLGHLEEAFPAQDGAFNLLYLVSSAQPPFSDELARWARARGARLVWNQDGVAYPAWAGAAYRRVNAAMRALLEQADYVIYQSEFCRASADHWIGPPRAPWEILYNCVDTARFSPATPPVLAKPWVLLTAGSHQQRERVLSALCTLAVLRRRGQRARLLVAGVLDWSGGDDEVAQAVRELRLQEEVELLGPYAQADAPALFRRAHVLLHTKYKDPSPTVPLEAMASGVPVVGSRSGGLPEVVGDTGLLLEVPDSWDEMHTPASEALAEAVTAVMADWPTWSARARQRAETRFRKEAWVDRHRLIFRQVLGLG